MVTWRAIAFVPLLMAATPSARAEPGSPDQPYEVTRATSEIIIDGAIDEPAWDDALTLELKYEVQPGENIPPPVRTQVLITYDEHRVLVAFRAFDPDPARIRARFRDRDHAWQDDWVGIVLDTFNDERRAYEFISNPLGVQTDAINDNVTNRYDIAWDAIWESAGRLTDFGYEVEIGIPFNQLRFQNLDGPQVWGVDAMRSYPRVERHHIGLFPDRDEVWIVNPFSSVPTDYPVATERGRYWAACAWDAIGVPAILGIDGWTESRCAESGEPLSFGVRGGELAGDDGVIHLVVPLRDAWHDIGFT